jgi:hypothetical protein
MCPRRAEKAIIADLAMDRPGNSAATRQPLIAAQPATLAKLTLPFGQMPLPE